MNTTLIVPGLNGSGSEHWQQIWVAENPDAQVVNQHDWQHPDLEEWIGALEYELLAHPGAIVVGHSLGALLVAHLARRPAAGHVGGALLVAPCDIRAVERLHPETVRFGSNPLRPLPFPSITVVSGTDPYLTIENARRFAAIWGSGLIELGDAGHINPASGYGRWEEGYVLAASLAAGTGSVQALRA